MRRREPFRWGCNGTWRPLGALRARRSGCRIAAPRPRPLRGWRSERAIPEGRRSRERRRRETPCGWRRYRSRPRAGFCRLPTAPRDRRSRTPRGASWGRAGGRPLGRGLVGKRRGEAVAETPPAREELEGRAFLHTHGALRLVAHHDLVLRREVEVRLGSVGDEDPLPP